MLQRTCTVTFLTATCTVHADKRPWRALEMLMHCGRLSQNAIECESESTAVSSVRRRYNTRLQQYYRYTGTSTPRRCTKNYRKTETTFVLLAIRHRWPVPHGILLKTLKHFAARKKAQYALRSFLA